MRTIRTKVYKFNELSNEAKEKAIQDHIMFEISEIGLREDDEEMNYYYPLMMEMGRMQTPWFLPEYIYEKAKDVIIETIEANEYEFYSNGKLI